MFTGLVADMGKVESIERTPDGARVRISTALASELAEGDSISVGGACLTATSLADGAFEADAMNQTLELTTLGGLATGDRVNLELALRASDRLGGHIVQGHVDGVGEVSSVTEDGIAKRVEISAPAELLPLIAERGSIAVDGVSLTTNSVDGLRFTVNLIPHTLAVTTLSQLAVGARVNLEADLIARYVERLRATDPAAGSRQ